jgi:hypothetical protein
MNELTPDEHGMLVDAIHDSATVIHKGQRMNERIQELMLEAGKTIPGDKHIDADFCKKFAELIIEECGVALSPMLRDMVSRGQAYDLIKQHFGFEESRQEKFRKSFEEAFKDGVDLSGRETP